MFPCRFCHPTESNFPLIPILLSVVQLSGECPGAPVQPGLTLRPARLPAALYSLYHSPFPEDRLHSFLQRQTTHGKLFSLCLANKVPKLTQSFCRIIKPRKYM